ncbi:threonine dehydratase [Neoasaia chiangmaiensis NBRC 101099]|uniref:Threonine ammonia-lyase n=1 Tax=Neoasaia chiangmaiensis TaxID=320497 RepID=A0A1U9KP29_9PROT|nr:threonine ammonia-lyase [Neoasaia chiangmaiensis]AQS87565.1 threonine ammonia-lyase [Neoasaia chiangmaiensis]GBR42250.1 threonine dehydratase [Neoasaia chiangmaiensis NBRC 101099]GEN14117.1 threonine ammonia-lyase [Neoasaia chiangmaiensis]
MLQRTTETPTFADIAAAHARIAPRIVRSPTLPCPALSKLTGAEIWLKLENLQAIASFKERGAANKLALLTEEERARGVIAVSAGNHAQGVARHASLLGIDATIVMPRFTPTAKVERTRGWGANVVTEGEDFAAASLVAEEIRRRENRVLVHPFNDPAVMAGQGTFGIELLEDAPELDALVLPIGGGGLISGTAIAAAHMRPGLDIYGVQVESHASLSAFPQAPVDVRGGSTIAEGIAVTTLGDQCYEAARPHLSGVLVVTELQVESAIALLAEHAKQVSEGAGAAALAAVMAYPDIFQGKRLALPISGGNIGTRILANTLLRALRRDGRLLSLILQIPDRPGVLADIATRIGNAGGNIIEVSHQRLFAAPSVQTAELEIMVEARDSRHADAIEADLRAHYVLTRG